MDNFKDQLLTGLTGAMAISAAMILTFEGMSNKAYYDVSHIPTICIGDTSNVYMDMVLSDQECIKRFKEKHPKIHAFVRRKVNLEMSPNMEAALASFVYNFGEKKFSESTLLKKLNDGDIVGGCDQFLEWRKTKTKDPVKDIRDGKLDGRMDCKIVENECPGLYDRRVKERARCLK